MALGDADSTPVSLQDRMMVGRSLYPILLASAAASNDINGLTALEELVGDELQFNCVDYDGRTLYLAAVEGHEECVEHLLLRGASVHVLDRFGHTPLFCAVVGRQPAVISILRRTGAHFTECEVDECAYRMHR